MESQSFTNPWDENSCASVHDDFEQSIWMDFIPADDELGNFLAEPDPISNDDDDDDSLLDLVSEDSMMVVDMVPMDFLSSPDEDERVVTPTPSLSRHYLYSTNDDDLFLSPASTHSSKSQDIEDQHQLAIERLRASMRRSEETRQHIRRQLYLRPTALVTKSFPNSMEFFAGSRSTLTTGLEQSRQLLLTYL